MELAIMIEPQIGGTYDEILAIARWAEEAGLDALARSDHYYSNRDPRPDATDAFATLAGLARETSRIKLNVLVSPLTFRHPAVVAKNAATIDQMSGGRMELGVGTGWMELEHEAFGLPFPEWRERFDRLEEGLQYLRAAFGPGPAQFSGRYYRLDAQVGPRPTGPLPLVVGGSGPRRTPALAGRFADEYNQFVGPPDRLAERIATMRAAAEEAGRPPGSVKPSAMGPVLVGADTPDYRARLEQAAERRGVAAGELEARLAGEGVPLGTPDRAVEALEAMEQAGIRRYYIQHLDTPDLATIARIVEPLL